MIKKEQKDRIKALGLDLDAIIAAHNDAAEVDITLPEGQIFTDAELATRDGVQKTAGKGEEGIAARAALIAEVKNRLNIEVAGDRIGDIVKAIGTELAKQTPDEKVRQLTDQVNRLTTTKTNLEKERDTFKSNAEKIGFEFDQYSQFPTNKTGDMTDKERFMLLGARGVEVKSDGIYKNGALMVDPKTQGAMPHKEAYGELFKEYKWTAEAPAAPPGGRGGTNNTGGGTVKASKQSEAIEMWKSQNPQGNEMSAEASAFVMAQAQGNTSFDFAA